MDVHKGGRPGVRPMWTHMDRGRWGRKPDFFVDVINGWPIYIFSEISRSCFMHIPDIRDLQRSRHMLDLKTAFTIATSTCIVYAKLDHCNSLFLNIDITQISRLQAIQNAEISPVLSLKPQNTTTSLLFSKAPLTIPERIEYL